ncbi:hypothetical protein B0H66DRAFT_544724 [Apodospora peruviana]|uniref:Uncharacterized protein n=1 Tax=Apodospora peruviana TaxID=516989 RepID=A0AAE0MGD5_9PEZI|nr:hypothetical protein B0H66DRAFT_544724 [Apodospora peruviana]
MSSAISSVLAATRILPSSSKRIMTVAAAASSGTPSATAKMQTQANQSSSDSFESIGVKNTNINVASGVNLSSHQELLVGSILDLFEGNPTLKHLSLWSPTATFADNLTVAEGFDRYAAQWYGLPTVFKPISIQSHKVVSAGNPIEIDLRNKYTLKGIKTEQEIASKVKIFVDSASGKISRVEDRWNDKLPGGAISQAFRKLNAVTVPTMVKVPKTEEEDMKMKAELKGQK